MPYDNPTDLPEYLIAVERDPERQHGKPVVKGTRTPVWCVVQFLMQGYDVEEVQKQYPQLTKREIRDCRRYTIKLLQENLIKEED